MANLSSDGDLFISALSAAGCFERTSRIPRSPLEYFGRLGRRIADFSGGLRARDLSSLFGGGGEFACYKELLVAGDDYMRCSYRNQYRDNQDGENANKGEDEAVIDIQGYDAWHRVCKWGS